MGFVKNGDFDLGWREGGRRGFEEEDLGVRRGQKGWGERMVSMRERRIHQYREFSSLWSASSLVHSSNIFGWFGFVHLDWLNLKEDNVSVDPYKGILV